MHNTEAGAAMDEIRYEAPTTVAATLALLSAANGHAKVLAGGTDLLVQMRAGRVEPELLVDIKRLPETTAIMSENGRFRFGAALPCMDLIEHAAFARAWPGVIDGIKLIGSIQVKGRATVGGNLCNASLAADSVPPLIAGGARVTIVGPRGIRDAAVEDIATGPGQTSLQRGEFILSFDMPQRAPHSGEAYFRFTPRTEMDIAVVGAAVSLILDAAGVCTDARVSLGAVAERALLVPEAAAQLVGTPVDARALGRLAEAASAACRPIDDKRGTRAFRIEVAGVMARRAAQRARARAKENG
ncbi:MAG: FAD binding domain-containing protein [Burkholderiales bacterium]